MLRGSVTEESFVFLDLMGEVLGEGSQTRSEERRRQDMGFVRSSPMDSPAVTRTALDVTE